MGWATEDISQVADQSRRAEARAPFRASQHKTIVVDNGTGVRNPVMPMPDLSSFVAVAACPSLGHVHMFNAYARAWRVDLVHLLAASEDQGRRACVA